VFDNAKVSDHFAIIPTMQAPRSLTEAEAKLYDKPNKRVFDNAKVSDHFAIIPTMQAPRSLTEAEAKLYD
ncbi:hypothetical protein, partial [Morganella morganii]|uniref:hypothetical protein n=1 Tax=Morganella morganii TaxID=582 RepID=UPI000BCBA099